MEKEMSDYIKYEVKVYANGDKSWCLNGELHRIDGPAWECASGYKSWYKNGKLHRIDGPAVEYPNDCKAWYKNGEYHREDGPAIEYANGDKYWYLNGIECTEANFNKEIAKHSKSPCEGKIVKIDGKKYTLTSLTE